MHASYYWGVCFEIFFCELLYDFFFQRSFEGEANPKFYGGWFENFFLQAPVCLFFFRDILRAKQTLNFLEVASKIIGENLRQYFFTYPYNFLASTTAFLNFPFLPCRLNISVKTI